MPAETVYVFDACAVIALLKAEAGAPVVVDLLQDESYRCLVHAINVCEIYYDLYRRDGEEIADGVKEILEGYGFDLVEGSTLDSLEDRRQAQGYLEAGFPGRLLRLGACAGEIGDAGDERPP